jgi:hypothetical protein
VPLFVVGWRLNFIVLVILAIYEKMAEGWKVHDEMLFVVKLNASYLNCYKVDIFLAIFAKFVVFHAI